MDKNYFVGNNKAAYNTAGIVAGEARKHMEESYNIDDANIVLKAISAQMRVNEVEVRIANAKVKIDDHNRKYGANIGLRNVESTQF